MVEKEVRFVLSATDRASPVIEAATRKFQRATAEFKSRSGAVDVDQRAFSAWRARTLESQQMSRDFAGLRDYAGGGAAGRPGVGGGGGLMGTLKKSLGESSVFGLAARTLAGGGLAAGAVMVFQELMGVYAWMDEFFHGYAKQRIQQARKAEQLVKTLGAQETMIQFQGGLISGRSARADRMAALGRGGGLAGALGGNLADAQAARGEAIAKFGAAMATARDIGPVDQRYAARQQLNGQFLEEIRQIKAEQEARDDAARSARRGAINSMDLGLWRNERGGGFRKVGNFLKAAEEEVRAQYDQQLASAQELGDEGLIARVLKLRDRDIGELKERARRAMEEVGAETRAALQRMAGDELGARLTGFDAETSRILRGTDTGQLGGVGGYRRAQREEIIRQAQLRDAVRMGGLRAGLLDAIGNPEQAALLRYELAMQGAGSDADRAAAGFERDIALENARYGKARAGAAGGRTADALSITGRYSGAAEQAMAQGQNELVKLAREHNERLKQIADAIKGWKAQDPVGAQLIPLGLGVL